MWVKKKASSSDVPGERGGDGATTRYSAPGATERGIDGEAKGSVFLRYILQGPRRMALELGW